MGRTAGQKSRSRCIELPDTDGNPQVDVSWIRWESQRRYHAIYVSALGVHWTYCGRSIRPAAVLEESGEPPARCRHCRLRVRSAFLVPDRLKALRAEQGLSMPQRRQR
jgi:hypothetical protein